MGEETRLYIIVREASTNKIVHYIAISDSNGMYKLVNLNYYKLLQGAWDTIKDIREYFKLQQKQGKIFIIYNDKEYLKFTQ